MGWRQWESGELALPDEIYRHLVEADDSHRAIGLDEEGRVLAWSTGAYRLTGLSPRWASRQR